MPKINTVVRNSSSLTLDTDTHPVGLLRATITRHSVHTSNPPVKPALPKKSGRKVN